MCGCVRPHETGLSVDRVFRVEPISRRDRGLWALSAEPRFSSSPFPSHSPQHRALILQGHGMKNIVVSGLWFPFKVSPVPLFSKSSERVRNLQTDFWIDVLPSIPDHKLRGRQTLKTANKNWSFVHSESLMGLWRMNRERHFHVRGQKNNIECPFMFFASRCPWESEGTVFFLFCAQSKIAETSRHYLAKSRPNICDVYWHIDFPWQLLAEGVRRMGPCVRVHGSLLRSRQHYAHQENEA